MQQVRSEAPTQIFSGQTPQVAQGTQAATPQSINQLIIQISAA
jgi:hypothetical protein